MLSACEGPAGPAGPQGERGPRGETGATGMQGPAGEDAALDAYLNAGILGFADTNDSGGWDIFDPRIKSSSIIQVYTRVNQRFMWFTPDWFLDRENKFVRILKGETAKVGYEYQIFIFNP